MVHTAHTLAAVKNAALAEGDEPEPPLRSVGEQQVVDAADRLIVNTDEEARQLVSLHQADPRRIDVVHPGVDLQTFTPGDRLAARAALGLPPGARIVAFVGRVQPLKAPDVLLRAAALLPDVRVLIAGGPSGSGLASPDGLRLLAAELGIADRVDFLPPQPPERLAQVYRAADLVAVPSYSSPSGWSRSRRRPAAHRWWPRRWVGFRLPSRTVPAGPWSTGTTRRAGRGRSRNSWPPIRRC